MEKTIYSQKNDETGVWIRINCSVETSLWRSTKQFVLISFHALQYLPLTSLSELPQMEQHLHSMHCHRYLRTEMIMLGVNCRQVGWPTTNIKHCIIIIQTLVQTMRKERGKGSKISPFLRTVWCTFWSSWWSSICQIQSTTRNHMTSWYSSFKIQTQQTGSGGMLYLISTVIFCNNFANSIHNLLD
jgi:hypothetical protein